MAQVPEEPLVKIAARRALRSARREAATPEFGRFLLVQGSGAAGDALVAIALAGSLFFSVPEATARGRVLLYLALTMAPFAIVAPFLARFLDRHRGSLRMVAVVSALGRGTLAWLLATRLDRNLWLFPIAFAILLLSRSSLVVRGALLPPLAPADRGLLASNSTVTKAGALAAALAAIPGLVLARFVGTDAELLLCSAVYYVGAVPALRLPGLRGRRTHEERSIARGVLRAPEVRSALVATAGLRLLVGFLVFHLAFAFRREDVGSLGLGFLVASAALGSLFGALVAPRLRRALKEEGILVVALVIAGIAGLAAGRWFSLFSAGVLVLAIGIAAGAAKLAFDSIVGRAVPEAGRGWAFARFESGLQLAWVLGAIVPLVFAIAGGPGVFATGVVANILALLYTLGRHQLRRAEAGVRSTRLRRGRIRESHKRHGGRQT